MSSIYSPVSAASASASSEPECEPSPSARSIPTADVSSPSTGQMSLFGETSASSPWTKDGLFPTPTSDTSLRKNDYSQGGKGLGRTVSMSSAADFPAPDISVAGKGAGITGPQSGLWSEYARIIGEVRPRYVIVENVAALLGRGLERVLGDLAALGFDAEWHCIPASAVGAPHRRDRVWIIAYADSTRPSYHCESDARRGIESSGAGMGAAARDSGADVGFPSGARLSLWSGPQAEWALATTTGTGWWATEPDVGRVAHGVPARVDRLRALGNAVVPQIPEFDRQGNSKCSVQHAHGLLAGLAGGNQVAQEPFCGRRYVTLAARPSA